MLPHDGTLDSVLGRRPRRGNYFLVLCIGLVVLNLSTFAYHLTGASAFNLVSNALGVGLMAYSVLELLRAGARGRTGARFLLLASAAALPSLLLNAPDVSAVDVLKYLSVFIFFAAGQCHRGPSLSVEGYAYIVLAAAPILFMGIGASRIYDREAVGYLPNANTAVLYMSSILFAASQMLGNRAIILQLVNAAVMNKIGALAATLGAVALWIAFPIRKEAIVGGTVVVVVCIAALMLGAFDRAIGVFETLSFVFKVDPRAVASMPYKELVQLTGATDLSAFFRLIHWSNILDLYSSGIDTLLFGYGAGQTPALTFAGLVPHNDYLRILAEYGPASLFVFVCFLVHVRGSLDSGPAKVLFLVLCIYFFSENLIDNFTSMALFFAHAGRMSRSRAAAALTRHPVALYSVALDHGR
ncbi:O-antigen ligase family protein [uncultured Methylobacterium sp.]|jgi:hypothetical protein|uniref:O-antigen ligase family protein n=1 Tax=uncultured Methylobacterium sp. TaxID=157278 RepID=UPI002636DDC6|nr:O-antigen ligase family protein [uncultured Methylobacterium sp.]